MESALTFAKIIMLESFNGVVSPLNPFDFLAIFAIFFKTNFLILTFYKIYDDWDFRISKSSNIDQYIFVENSVHEMKSFLVEYF